MCRTGGPRCAGETMPIVAKTEAVYREAAEVYQEASLRYHTAAPPSPEAQDQWVADWKAAKAARDAAWDAHKEAMADMAASDRGEYELRRRMNSTGPDAIDPKGMHQILAEGVFRRGRGALARQVRERHHMDDLTGIVGKTGEARTDAVVEQAVRNVAMDPDRFPGWSHGLPAPVPSETEEGRAAMVASWRYAVQSKAEEVERRQRWAAEAARDLAMADASVSDTDVDADARARRVDEARERMAHQDAELRLAQADLAMTAVKFRECERQPLAGGKAVSIDEWFVTR